MDTLLDIDLRGWKRELEEVEKHLAKYAPRTPQALIDELHRMRHEIG